MAPMYSVRPSVSFFLGTTCGVLAALLLLHRLRHRTSWEVEQRERDDDRLVAPFLFPGIRTQPFDKETQSEHENYDGDGGEAEPEGTERRRRRRRRKKKRKVFLDCGANTATSVDLFLDTYPDGKLLVARARCRPPMSHL